MPTLKQVGGMLVPCAAACLRARGTSDYFHPYRHPTLLSPLLVPPPASKLEARLITFTCTTTRPLPTPPPASEQEARLITFTRSANDSTVELRRYAQGELIEMGVVLFVRPMLSHCVALRVFATVTPCHAHGAQCSGSVVGMVCSRRARAQ